MSRILLLLFLFFPLTPVLGVEPEQTEAAPSIAQLVINSATNPWSPGDLTETVANDESLEKSLTKTNETRNEERLARLQKPLSEIRLVVTNSEGDRPENLAAALLLEQTELVVEGSEFVITAPDRYTVPFCYRPLYFEELNLERCGNTYGCGTNLVSAVHFLTNSVALPYRLATQRADIPISTRGDCRTCQAFSHDIEPFGFEPKGVLIEAAAIAGFVFLAM